MPTNSDVRRIVAIVSEVEAVDPLPETESPVIRAVAAGRRDDRQPLRMGVGGNIRLGEDDRLGSLGQGSVPRDGQRVLLVPLRERWIARLGDGVEIASRRVESDLKYQGPGAGRCRVQGSRAT